MLAVESRVQPVVTVSSCYATRQEALQGIGRNTGRLWYGS